MEEEWREVHEFPQYSVSTTGRVRNDSSGRIMAQTVNQQRIPMVGFSSRREGYHKRAVALLVARAFVPHPFGAYDTPVNLDGDRMNNGVDNLMWRPRWFAICYHKQFKQRYHSPIHRPVIEVNTGEVCRDGFTACKKYGLLEKDLVLSILNRTVVWPTMQQFEVLEE